MSLVDTFLIDGTDLSNYARGITDFTGAFNTAPRRGANYVLPGSDGNTYVAKPLDVVPVSIGLIVLPADPSTGAIASTQQARTAQTIANYKAIVSLSKAETGGTVTLTRRLSTIAGSYTDETCTAECTGGIQVTHDASDVWRMVIGFVNLSGKWA